MFLVTRIVSISNGCVFGPFLGVSMSLYAVQHTNTGIVLKFACNRTYE